MRADGGIGDGGGLGLLLNHPGLLGLLAVAAVVLLPGAAASGWLVARRLRRSALLRRGALLLKVRGLPPGPGRELAGLRLGQRAVDSTFRGVTLARGSGLPVGELPALASRLSRVGAALDAQLGLLECEPDQTRLRAALPAARARVGRVTAAAGRIRTALAQLGAADNGAEVAALTADVAAEVDALQAGVTVLRRSGDAGG